MKSLSQSEYGELRSLYSKVYAPKFETILDEFTDEEVDELTEEVIEEVVEEFFLECLEEGWDIESVEETLCESLETSITNLNETYLMEMNPYAPAGSKESKAYNKATTSSKRSAERAAKRKEVIGKVKKAVGKVGSALKAGAGKAAGAARAGAGAAYKGASRAAGAAVGTVKKAGSVAKSEFKKGYDSASKSSSSDSGSSDSGSSSSSSSSGSSSSGSTRRAVGGAVRKVGSLLKKGLKKAVGGAARAVSKGADKVATRLGEEAIQEADSIAAMRERAAKRRKQRYGASDTSRGGRDDFRPYTKADYERGEANDPRKKVKEELELDQMIESLIERGHTEQEAYSLVAQFTLDEDSRRMSNKQKTASVRQNIKAFGSNFTPPNNYDPDANRGKGEVLTRKQIEKKRRKALRQEDVEFVDESQEARNNPEKYEREQSKKYAPVRGEKTPMPPRGDKRREDFEKWYAAQRR